MAGDVSPVPMFLIPFLFLIVNFTMWSALSEVKEYILCSLHCVSSAFINNWISVLKNQLQHIYEPSASPFQIFLQVLFDKK